MRRDQRHVHNLLLFIRYNPKNVCTRKRPRKISIQMVTLIDLFRLWR
jgi:hypothetical protein